MDNTYTSINMDDTYTGMFQFLATYLIIFLVIVIVIYIAIGIFLNKFNKLKYGKGTPMAFIPLVNIYLLGKLTISKPVGLILVFIPLLTGTFTTNINGVENTYTLLPADINSKVNTVYNLVTLGLLIYAIVLYFKLKKEQKNGTYINEQEKRPLENQNKDIINNVINATKETNTINSYNENISNNSNTTDNVNNYNVGNTSINKVETSPTVNTNAKANVNSNANTTPNNNAYSNNGPSELMKQYQNNDLNK